MHQKSMKKTIIDGQAYLVVTWEETGEHALKLAEKIIKSGNKYDRVIALAKGGLTWSRTMVDFLAIPNLSTMQVSFYTDIASTTKTPIITQSLPMNIQGERVLIFDDVSDSGETLLLTKKYLKMHGAKSVTTATLSIKSWTSYVPDFYSFSSSEWIIFPHESRETIGMLKKSWKKKGVSDVQVKTRLRRLGLKKSEIDVFYPLV
jgi:hypoxanthine phosphoribosyltransferase